MTIRAYVFVESTLGNAIEVAVRLGKLPEVKMAHAVPGAYDVIALVEAESLAVLGELLSRRIHRLPGVLKTTTNVVVEPGGADAKAGSAEGQRA